MLSRIGNFLLSFIEVPAVNPVNEHKPHPDWAKKNAENKLKSRQKMGTLETIREATPEPITEQNEYPLTGHLADHDLESRDENENTLLIQALCGNDLEYMTELLDRGVYKEGRGNKGFTPLAAAAFLGNVDAASLLIARRVDVNLQTDGDEVRRSPLGWAAIQGHVEMVKLLLRAGAHVDDRDSEQNTPLILAAAMGREAVIPVLLERGANPNLQGHSGYTATAAAASIGRNDIVSLLFNHLANKTRKPQGQEGEDFHEEIDARFHLLGAWADSALADKALYLQEGEEMECVVPVKQKSFTASTPDKQRFVQPTDEELREMRVAFYKDHRFNDLAEQNVTASKPDEQRLLTPTDAEVKEKRPAYYERQALFKAQEAADDMAVDSGLTPQRPRF